MSATDSARVLQRTLDRARLLAIDPPCLCRSRQNPQEEPDEVHAQAHVTHKTAAAAETPKHQQRCALLAPSAFDGEKGLRMLRALRRLFVREPR